MIRVAVIDSGVANLASVRSALHALGVESAVTVDPRDVLRATHVVLPGVGSFTQVDRLHRTGLTEALRRHASDDKPLLAICLGMQMLCEGSEEAPMARGVGIIPAVCRKLGSGCRVPHLGWNAVRPDDASQYVAPGIAAFANSYAVTEAPATPSARPWRVAWTEHAQPFVSAIERGRLLACQFHPELSGPYGTALLSRWLCNEPVSQPEAIGGGGPRLRIIPCLDVQDGRVVKGIKFQDLRDSGDPAERAGLYEEQGADEIVILDIAASPQARDNQTETVRRVRRRIRIPLTVGGGVRGPDDAHRLLSAGADKVSINTAAVKDPALLTALADRFGTQCVVLAIDARRHDEGYEVLVMGGREPAHRSAAEWAAEGVTAGAGEILLTSWDRDGTRAGYDLDLLAAVRGAVEVPVIASGGIGERHHVLEAFRAGADAVLAASIFHDDDDTVRAVKHYLRDEGIPVRL